MAEMRPAEREASLSEQVCDNLFELAQVRACEKPMTPLLALMEDRAEPGDTVLLFEPHADDGPIAAGGCAIDLAEMGYRVLQLCLYSGERSSGFPSDFSPAKRRRIREQETVLASQWLGTEPHFLALDAYNREGYRPSSADKKVMTELIVEHQPGAVFCPPGTDRHPAHRAARALIAWTLWATRWQCPIITYTTPWGQPWQYNCYHVLSKTTAFRKRQAIRAYTSQQGINANYARFSHHQGRAWLGLLQQLTRGPYFVPEDDCTKEEPCGVELYQREEYAPGHLAWDPIQQVLGSFQGALTLESDLDNTALIAPSLAQAKEA